MEAMPTFTAFAGQRQIASGELRSVLLETKRRLEQGEQSRVLVFNDLTGQQVDFDLSGTEEEALARLEHHPGLTPAREQRQGPGRPKLGVVCREVSLLPRHWEWLEHQPQGASAALRRLVDEARKRDPAGERQRQARDAAAKFMWSMAGDLPGFEEASRALYADERAQFEAFARAWPKDIGDHVLRLLRSST
jgi:hypothetical protein